LRTLKALLGDHIADAVEHAVRCEQILEPLGVQGITLAIMVRLQDDREVGLLTLGEVAVGERQPGRRDRRVIGQGGGRRPAGQCAHGQRRGRGDGREGRAAREERSAVRGGHGHSLRWAGRGEVQHLLPGKQRASVPVVIVISPLGIDQGVSRLTAETVRGRHRIPVIYG
jgi:hypothetical protein